ncbi:MAG: FG-GAP-like repeat-containing protein [Thermoleophilia bacterium]
MNPRPIRLRRRTALFAAAVSIATAGAAVAGLPQQTGPVDLRARDAELKIVGFPGALGNSPTFNHRLAAVGDVNGDGTGDILVGAAGVLVFGRPAGGVVRLTALGDAGVHIIGAPLTGNVAAAGDVNGDGLADMLIGVAGGVEVVFGSRSRTDVDLAHLGRRGFLVAGATTMAPAGDLNGDGRADVLFGTGGLGYPDHTGNTLNSAFVLLGADSADQIDLAGPPSPRLVRIQGPAGEDFGSAVTAPGDVNGDGVPDLVVAARFGGSNHRGAVYVVPGTRPPQPVDLTLSPTGAYPITAPAVDYVDYGLIGSMLSPAGDVNGDGLADFVIGSRLTKPSGVAYVVFGSRDGAPLNVATLGTRGQEFDGPLEVANTYFGWSLAGGQDVNGDGHSDVVVGAPWGSGLDASRGFAGDVFVLQQAAPGVTVRVDSLEPPQGFRIGGAIQGEFTGTSVDVGDVNGDGHPDVLLESPGADGVGPPDRSDTGGLVSVVFGFGPSALAYPQVHATAGVPLSPVEPGTKRFTGAPKFTAVPPLPAGLSVDPDTGVISGTPRTAGSLTTTFIVMQDLVDTISAPITVRVDAPVTGGGAAGTPATTRRRARGLALAITRRGGVVTAHGTLLLPPGAVCAGRVTVVMRHGHRVVRTAHTPLRRTRGGCRYTVAMRSRVRPLTVTARFTGTPGVRPINSGVRRV